MKGKEKYSEKCVKQKRRYRNKLFGLQVIEDGHLV